MPDEAENQDEAKTPSRYVDGDDVRWPYICDRCDEAINTDDGMVTSFGYRHPGIRRYHPSCSEAESKERIVQSKEEDGRQPFIKLR